MLRQGNLTSFDIEIDCCVWIRYKHQKESNPEQPYWMKIQRHNNPAIFCSLSHIDPHTFEVFALDFQILFDNF